MLNSKRLLLSSIGIAAFFVGVNVHASSPHTIPTPPNDGGACVWFDCEFDGGGAGKDKTGGWEQNCKASGVFMRDDNDLGIQNDNDNHLKFECKVNDDDDNGDHHGDVRDGNGDYFKVIYDDSARVHFDHDTRSLWIKGVDDHGNAPVIVIDLGDRNATTLDDNGGDHDRRLPADTSYSFRGFSYDIPGFCRLHKTEPTPGPTTSPTPPPVR